MTIRLPRMIAPKTMFSHSQEVSVLCCISSVVPIQIGAEMSAPRMVLFTRTIMLLFVS